MLYKFFQILLGPIIRPLFLFEIRGMENIPKEDGYIVCSNHKSNWDPVFLALTFRPKLYFMAKKELFDIPIIKSILRGIGVFPVDREGRDLQSLKYSMKLIKEGKNICILPEGTRTKDIDRVNMKDGVAYVALKSKADIVPVEIISKFRPFTKTYIYIKEPIANEKFQHLKSKEAMVLMTDEIYEGIYGRQLEKLESK